MRRESRFLLAGAVWTGAALAAVKLTDSVALRTLFAVPMVCVLPGASLLKALQIRFVQPQHMISIIGFSMALTVLSGFVLNIVGMLTPTGWVEWLGGVTLTGGLIAALRHGVATTPHGMPPVRLRHYGMAGAALVVLALAIFLAVRHREAYRPFTYTDFWLTPVEAGSGKGNGIYTVGIENGENTAQGYTVRLMTDGQIVGIWRHIQIEPQETFTFSVTLPQGGSAEAWLFRDSDSNTVYRKVSAALGGADSGLARHDAG